MSIRKLLKHFSWALLSLSLSGVIVLSFAYIYLSSELPDVSVLKDVHFQSPLRVMSSDGKLIAEFGTKKRIPITLNQVPQNLIHAVLATEDQRFYEHPGVDVFGLVRAAIAVITTGKKVQGASTITMQVARNFFLTRKKTYSRKITEILLALKIDRELSKNKVLELYLNKIFFGQRAYGVAAAAQAYYGKQLNQLTLPEMAMIAGLPQAPSRDNPIVNSQSAIKRRNHVLERMFDLHYIDKKTYSNAIKQPISAKYHELHISVYAPYVAELIRQAMVNYYGKEKAYNEGYTVYTTIKSNFQQFAESALQQGLQKYDRNHGYRGADQNWGTPPANISLWINKLKNIVTIHQLQPAVVTSVQPQSISAIIKNGSTITIDWDGLKWARAQLDNNHLGPKPKSANNILHLGDVIRVTQNNNQQWLLTQIPQVQGALVSMDPTNGNILALTGGYSFTISHFNRATQALRQPGSSIKPFIYSAALNKGYTLASIINDAPIVLPDTGENILWRPNNDNNSFAGPTRLAVGLSQSRNLVSIRILNAIGIDYAIKYISRFGFDPATLPKSLSLALGSNVVSPTQLATAYCAFANGGYKINPILINKIIDSENKVIFQSKTLSTPKNNLINQIISNNSTTIAPRIITPQNDFLMTHAMQDVIQNGTGRLARSLKRNDLAGKTGTTNKQMDAWFCGFDANLVTTVWMGFDNQKSLYEYASRSALPILINFMKNSLPTLPKVTQPQPSNIINVRIDPKTGLLAKPGQRNAIFEYFRKINSPTQFALTNKSSLQAWGNNNADNAKKNTEESTVEELF